MLRFGGAITIQSVLTYMAQNIDKVVIGRVSGAYAFGVYGRAYQLVNMPRSNLNSAVGWVAFSSLSRIQDDTRRYRSYFLKGYQVVLSIVVPMIVFGAVFADDVVQVVLGPRVVRRGPHPPTTRSGGYRGDSDRRSAVLATTLSRARGTLTADHSRIHFGDFCWMHYWRPLRCHRRRRGLLFALVVWLIPQLWWCVRNADTAQLSPPSGVAPLPWKCRRFIGFLHSGKLCCLAPRTRNARWSAHVRCVLCNHLVRLQAEGVLPRLGEGPKTDLEDELVSYRLGELLPPPHESRPK